MPKPALYLTRDNEKSITFAFTGRETRSCSFNSRETLAPASSTRAPERLRASSASRYRACAKLPVGFQRREVPRVCLLTEARLI